MDLIERLLRWYGRRHIAWLLYVRAVQDARLDDDPIPSDRELSERAKEMEQKLYEEHLVEIALPRLKRP